MEKHELTCIGCPLGCSVKITLENNIIISVAAPVRIGDVLVKDVSGTGVDIIATKNAKTI